MMRVLESKERQQLVQREVALPYGNLYPPQKREKITCSLENVSVISILHPEEIAHPEVETSSAIILLY